MSKTEDSFHLGVKALIKNSQGEILLLKVNIKKLSGTTKAYWDIPGGRVQRGDTVAQTLQREVEEETGIKIIKNIRPLAMVLSNIRIPLRPQDVGLILAVYTCQVAPNTEIKLSDEHTEEGWFSPKKSAELLAHKYPREFTDKLKIL